MKKVCHLISCLLKGDGPSNCILTQIAPRDGSEFQYSVWSLYQPPIHRNPQALLAGVGADYKVFKMSRSFLDLRVLFPLVQQLRAHRPTILHCHLVRANLYGRVAAKMAGIPVVVNTLHNIEEYMQGGGIIFGSVRRFEQMTARWVSKYVAVSEAVRQEAINCLHLPPDKIATILNAIDLVPYRCGSIDRSAVRAELGIQAEDVVVGSVGRLHRQKNYPFLIRMAKTIGAKLRNVRFVIIGDGEDRQSLERMIAHFGLQDSILLPGYRPDIPRVLGGFDIFVLPSSYEGLSIALMEAMAAGLPSIVTDVGGNAEAVVHAETGFVLLPGDEEGFTSSLETLLRNPDLRQSMGRAARERVVKLFDAERLTQEYVGLYQRLLEQSRR